MIFASGGRIATTGIDLAVCRDWVLVITADPSSTMHHERDTRANPLLTLLTTSLRRITLICKLLSPLLISLLTTTIGYQSTAAALIAFAVATLISEVIWLRVVWRKFDVLEQAEALRENGKAEQVAAGRAAVNPTKLREASSEHESRIRLSQEDNTISHQQRPGSVRQTPQRRLLASAGGVLAGWNEFRKMPVFLSAYLSSF